jgi:protease-4
MSTTSYTGSGQPPIIIKHKSSALPPAIVALAVIALIGLVLVMGGFVLLALMMPKSLPDRDLESSFVAGDRKASDEAVLIQVEGVIIEEPGEPPFSSGRDPVARVKKRLEKAVRDKAKAVILEVNSPGGGITASDLLYREIKRFKKEHPEIPVVVQMKDLAASGGYYISAPADWIVAMPTTLTASIGVILMQYNVKGLLDEKLGIKTESFVSGSHKDILSPYRDMTEDERKHVQGLIEEMFENFVHVVVDGRKGKVDAEQVRALQGTILSGRQALEKGLVDQLGTLDDAVAKAAELAQVKSLRVIRYARPKSALESLFEARIESNVQIGPTFDLKTYLDRGGSPFMYLWRL